MGREVEAEQQREEGEERETQPLAHSGLVYRLLFTAHVNRQCATLAQQQTAQRHVAPGPPAAALTAARLPTEPPRLHRAA